MSIVPITLENFPFLKEVENMGVDQKTGDVVKIDKTKPAKWVGLPADKCDMSQLKAKKAELGIR